MNILFVHQNFPGQFKHLAPALAKDTRHTVVALTMQAQAAPTWQGVQCVRYAAQRGNTPGIHPWLIDMESKTIRAEAALGAARALKAQGFVPDIIMVDYINLMASYRMKDNSNSYAYVKAIAEELRGVAMEFNCCVIAPTQTNRSGQNASDFELNEVSESHGISMTADVMFGFISTPDLEALGHMRIKMLKNRFGSTGNSFIVLINRAKMQLRDLDSLKDIPLPPRTVNKGKPNTGAIKLD